MKNKTNITGTLVNNFIEVELKNCSFAFGISYIDHREGRGRNLKIYKQGFIRIQISSINNEPMSYLYNNIFFDPISKEIIEHDLDELINIYDPIWNIDRDIVKVPPEVMIYMKKYISMLVFE